MLSPDEECLTVAEIAKTLKINQQTVRNWIDRRELPAVRVGRRVRIPRPDFDRFLAQGDTKKTTTPTTTRGDMFWQGELDVAPAPDPSRNVTE